MHKTQYKEIPSGEIRESKYHWKRKIDPERIEDLSNTIKEVGLIHPITVIKKASGKGYEYIAGERRFLASRKAGLKNIPCLVRDLGSIEAAEASIYENIQRVDMSAAEHDKAIRELVDLKKQKMEIAGGADSVSSDAAVTAVAKDARVSKKTVERALATKNLIKEAKAAYTDKAITKAQAITLAALSPKEQKAELPKMVEETQQETDRRRLAEKATPSADGDKSHTKAALRMFDMVVTRASELGKLTDELRRSLTDEVVLELREAEHDAIKYCHESMSRLMEDITSVVDWQNRRRG